MDRIKNAQHCFLTLLFPHSANAFLVACQLIPERLPLAGIYRFVLRHYLICS